MGIVNRGLYTIDNKSQGEFASFRIRETVQLLSSVCSLINVKLILTKARDADALMNSAVQ